MSDHAQPFDTGRVRPLVTSLDVLRLPIDLCVSARAGVARALDELGVDPARAIVVGVTQDQLAAARAADVRLAIGLARGADAPDPLRRAGATTIVADLQELLGPATA
jgi:beta-phosphoglucomutase-like phosphatase (HAD superfamily)